MSDVRFGQPSKVPELHNTTLALVLFGQLRQRGVERKQVYVTRPTIGDHLVERHPHPTARSLPALMMPGVIDENPSHHLRRHSQELCAVLPDDLMLACQSKVRLVDECSRLQSVAWPLATEIARRAAVQIVIHHSEELFSGFRATLAPRPKQVGHAIRGRLVHGPQFSATLPALGAGVDSAVLLP